jgi:hypothetical protein
MQDFMDEDVTISTEFMFALGTSELASQIILIKRCQTRETVSRMPIKNRKKWFHLRLSYPILVSFECLLLIGVLPGLSDFFKVVDREEMMV